MNICYLDAFSGLSGDMLVGALADAGADQKAIAAGVESLGIDATVSFERVLRRGISATKFRVAAPEEKKHRHLGPILKMIAAADLPERVKQNASRVFERLGQSEAAVHSVPIEKVHFHEVGAIDSIVDIVGACLAFDLLGAESIYCSAVNTGSGTVETEHGTLPVPAPATASLLRDKPVYARGPALELTTPTGAAIAVTLARQFGPMPPMQIEHIGYGAGDRDFQQHANVLRVLAGKSTAASEATTVFIIETNIDDTSPQVLAYAVERLLGEGALDASLLPAGMKKGRPATMLQAIVRPEDREKMAAILFEETSTLGVRTYAAERIVEERKLVEVETPWGVVRVKVSASGNIAPEYEDCRVLAIEAGVPLKKVIAEAIFQYQKSNR